MIILETKMSYKSTSSGRQDWYVIKLVVFSPGWLMIKPHRICTCCHWRIDIWFQSHWRLFSSWRVVDAASMWEEHSSQHEIRNNNSIKEVQTRCSSRCCAKSGQRGIRGVKETWRNMKILSKNVNRMVGRWESGMLK